MPFFSTLRRSSPCIHQFIIQRLWVRQSSTAPSSSPSLKNSRKYYYNQRRNPFSGSSLKWVSSIFVGSSLGLICWFSISNSDFESSLLKSYSSFTDWLTASSETAFDDVQRSSRSLLGKLSLPEINDSFLFGDAYRRKIFFNYEKRIRLRSPPEKVFEYFSSCRTPEGELLMKPADLMRAVVPVFPPSESHLVRDGYLRGERSPGCLRCVPSEFFMLFDVNNDGLISFKEYIFFVTLLSIPESSFSVAFKMFDRNNNGEIDKEEFKKVMAFMRSHNRQGANHRDGLRFGLKVNDSVENGGLVEHFFGKDGNGRLKHDKFVEFMRDLHNEIISLEFAHYDYELRGTISVEDFALSMVASADMSHLDRLLERVKELNSDPSLRDARITFDEFKTFADLRKNLLPFSFALFSFGEVNGLLTRDDFRRATLHVCGISLSDIVVDIVFHLFDTNRDGNLSSDEFVRVLHKREKDIAHPSEAGILGFISCCWNCADNLSSSRLLS